MDTTKQHSKIDRASVDTKSLPAYPTIGAFPPVSTAVNEYHIGDQILHQPFVSIEQLKAHIALLRAFQNLRNAVEGNSDKLPPHVRVLDQSALRWERMVSLAVIRFERWVKVVQDIPLDLWIAEEMPPIDVLMIWHAYMLNPTWYAEDCDRRITNLKALDGRLLEAIVRVGDIDAHVPSNARQIRWRKSTGTEWELLDAAASMTSRSVECPRCHTINTVSLVTDAGSGYIQENFQQTCTSCGSPISKDSIALLKFVRDLVLDENSAEDVAEHGLAVYFAGTLRTPYDPHSKSQARLAKLQILNQDILKKPKNCTRSEWENAIMTTLKFSMANIVPYVKEAEARRAGRVLSAYVDDRPFSIELVSAVIRQGVFIKNVAQFGWTKPGYFDTKDNESILMHAIARYHAFIDLIASSPGSAFVPMLDIDLVWHTHQMMGAKYNAECAKFLKYYLDHDDTIMESSLATSFESTSLAWEKRFQVPYDNHCCGCPTCGMMPKPPCDGIDALILNDEQPSDLTHYLLQIHLIRVAQCDLLSHAEYPPPLPGMQVAHKPYLEELHHERLVVQLRWTQKSAVAEITSALP